jgi:hypothetical protein
VGVHEGVSAAHCWAKLRHGLCHHRCSRCTTAVRSRRAPAPVQVAQVLGAQIIGSARGHPSGLGRDVHSARRRGGSSSVRKTRKAQCARIWALVALGTLTPFPSVRVRRHAGLPGEVDDDADGDVLAALGSAHALEAFSGTANGAGCARLVAEQDAFVRRERPVLGEGVRMPVPLPSARWCGWCGWCGHRVPPQWERGIQSGEHPKLRRV